MSDALQPASLVVDAAMIRAYAELTDDFNPLHLDAAFAAATPMGGVIAHGTMSVCLLLQSLSRSLGPGALASLELDLRFVRPVRIGDRVTAGGAARPGTPGSYDVWVRGDDGEERIAGTARVAAHDRFAGAGATPG